jgi:hypothetical protein
LIWAIGRSVPKYSTNRPRHIVAEVDPDLRYHRELVAGVSPDVAGQRQTPAGDRRRRACQVPEGCLAVDRGDLVRRTKSHLRQDVHAESASVVAGFGADLATVEVIARAEMVRSRDRGPAEDRACGRQEVRRRADVEGFDQFEVAETCKQIEL